MAYSSSICWLCLKGWMTNLARPPAFAMVAAQDAHLCAACGEGRWAEVLCGLCHIAHAACACAGAGGGASANPNPNQGSWAASAENEAGGETEGGALREAAHLSEQRSLRFLPRALAASFSR